MNFRISLFGLMK